MNALVGYVQDMSLFSSVFYSPCVYRALLSAHLFIHVGDLLYVHIRDWILF